MWSKVIVHSLNLILVSFLISSPAMAQAGKIPSADASYSFSQSLENRSQYHLVITDADERTVSGVFTMQQVKILQAIMLEAEKFALTQEAAGTDKPNTIRFYDKQENSFLIDVQKLGNRSQLFLTLETELGRLTVNAGAINRSTKKEEGFYFTLLDRIEAEISKASRQPSR
jgi:hypothetical protein